MAATKKIVSLEALALKAIGELLTAPGPKALGDIFKGKTTKPAADVALVHGWLEPTGEFLETGKGKTKKRTELYRLTVKGVGALLDQSDESQLFNVLKKALEELPRGASGRNEEQQRVMAQVTKDLNEQCAGLRHEVSDAVKNIQAHCEAVTQHLNAKLAELRGQLLDGSANTEPLRQAMALLAAKTKPLDLDELAKKIGSAPPAAARAQPSVADAPDWLDEVVHLVTEQKKRNSFQALTLKDIYDRLKTTRPHLALGPFHDGMRRLHKERRVRLAPYTLALATLPDPSTALYLDNEVKYYVEVAH